MGRAISIVRPEDGEALKVLGVDVRFLCRAEDTNGAWSAMETVIAKNAGPPPHRHAWDEAYFVTAGEVAFELDGRRERVGPGAFVYAPGGAVHAFHGLSEEPARMLIFDAPAHAAAFFTAVDREQIQIPRDLPKMLEIGAKTGVEFLHPA